MGLVTLSYDKKDERAVKQLSLLLEGALFTELSTKEEELPGIDYNDPWLWEDHGDLPPLPKGKETFTPEEALEMILDDVRHIYGEDDAA